MKNVLILGLLFSLSQNAFSGSGYISSEGLDCAYNTVADGSCDAYEKSKAKSKKQNLPPNKFETPMSNESEKLGVTQAKLEAFLTKERCFLADARVAGINSAREKVMYPDILCISNQTVNPGGINESTGCTLFLFKTQKGIVNGLGQFRNDFPQVKQRCEDGGLSKLVNKDWGGISVGKLFLNGSYYSGGDPEYWFGIDESAKKILEEIKQNNGKTTLEYKPDSALSKLKSLFN